MKYRFFLSSVFATCTLLCQPTHAFSLGDTLKSAAQVFNKNKTQDTPAAPTPATQGPGPTTTSTAEAVVDCRIYQAVGAPQFMGDQIEADKLQRRARGLCRENYFSYFDPATKTPLWVVERVSAEAAGQLDRTDNFSPDPDVPYAAQAALTDYRGSGLDRGHMAPAADMLTDNAMSQSFYLTNMVPQVGPNMNRGIWADLEKMVRGMAQSDARDGQEGYVYVYTGPVFEGQVSVMGKGKVWVPTKLFKVIYRPANGQIMSFIIPNVQIVTRKTKSLDEGNPLYPQTTPQMAINCGLVCTPESFKTTLEAVEAATRWRFLNGVPRTATPGGNKQR